jgi:molybdopterin/thiamine biosynthesis adenylyltransferase
MGGVGGVHLATLARLGIGSFHVADPDRFEVANFNRQYGADVHTLGQNKATAMAAKAQAINPELNIRVFSEAVTAANVAEFLDGVDLLVDGIDFFAIEARRLVFQEARRRGIWAITAGPIGFSTAWLTFSPTGMSFDSYFDVQDSMDRLDQLVAFAVGLTPRATHLGYMDLSNVDLQSGRGPSAGLACQLCSGVIGAEALKILLGRAPLFPAPWFCQFDPYRQLFRKGRLWWGNRHPWQRIKRWWLRRKLTQMGLAKDVGLCPAMLVGQ